MVQLLNEFKKFALRGNVVDMAVGIIIGAAFGKIVSSLVADIITPLLGILIGGVNFNQLAFTAGNLNIHYGKFIQTVFDFTIVAAAIFLVIKSMNRLEKKQEQAPPKITPEQELLKEIRDLLKTK